MESLSSYHTDPYALLFKAISMIPISHYLVAFTLSIFIFLYNFLEFHFLQDLLTGFRGCPVVLTYNPASQIYHGVVSKCHFLHGRYLATPWLSSPHIQTSFLNFHGRPPVFNYRRQIFKALDGGTIALDWLKSSDVLNDAVKMIDDDVISKDDTTPLVVVIPGLTSDSSSAYLKHLAFNTAKRGWNVVISNHRGLGGVPITSDCFYNAGWTEDIRAVINHLHHEYPNTPLFVVGTSIGANILVKYLGEDGEKVPVAGAAAICCPWDLLIGCRFISRRLVQRFYDRALTIGLQGYAQLHQPQYTRLANWEGIKTSRTIRDFDNHATCLVGKYETVDTYYRRCSSASFVGSVAVPLLCISALDDPVCTKEAIPWDECRMNQNVVLATIKHGGHLAFFEGITGSSLWWVKVVNEFLSVLHSSPYMHVEKINTPKPQTPLDSSIDHSPYVNVTEDGMVSASDNEPMTEGVDKLPVPNDSHSRDVDRDQRHQGIQEDKVMTGTSLGTVPENAEIITEQVASMQDAKSMDVITPMKKCLIKLSRHSQWSFWLLAYIAAVSSWPMITSIFNMVFRKKSRNFSPGAPFKR